MEGFQALQPGDPQQVGPYRIVARLGGGGMGQVYLGQSRGGRAFALKVIRPELAQNGDFRRRFVREVASARRVNGVFTAGVVDADPEGSPAWLATAYVPGVPLDQAVIRHGPWAEQPATALAAALAEALEGIHAVGVVHRDLKPSNVLLAADGPRVIDFGISLPQGSAVTSITGAGQVAGTPGFMSPEQLKALPVGPASDVFSLGALLALVTTGSGPFGHGSLHELMFRIAYEEPRLDGVPPGLRAVIARCLAKDAAQRPSMGAVLDELAESVNRRQDAAFTTAGWLPAAVARDVHARSTAPQLLVEGGASAGGAPAGAGPSGAGPGSEAGSGFGAVPAAGPSGPGSGASGPASGPGSGPSGLGSGPSGPGPAGVVGPPVTGVGGSAPAGRDGVGRAATGVGEPVAAGLTDQAAPAGTHPVTAPGNNRSNGVTGPESEWSSGTFGPGEGGAQGSGGGAEAAVPGAGGPQALHTGLGVGADGALLPQDPRSYGSSYEEGAARASGTGTGFADSAASGSASGSASGPGSALSGPGWAGPPNDPLVQRQQQPRGGTPSGPAAAGSVPSNSVPSGAVPSHRSARRRQPTRGLWVAAAVCGVLGVGVTTWLLTPFSMDGAHKGDGSAVEEVGASAPPGASPIPGLSSQKPKASSSASSSASPSASATATGRNKPTNSASPGPTATHTSGTVTTSPGSVPVPTPTHTIPPQTNPPASTSDYFVSDGTPDYVAQGTITWNAKSVTISVSLKTPKGGCADVRFDVSGGDDAGRQERNMCDGTRNFTITEDLAYPPEEVIVELNIEESDGTEVSVGENDCTPSRDCN